MKRYIIEQRLKSVAAFLVIIILLPYIVSVFVNGADVTAGDSGSSFYVKNHRNKPLTKDGNADII